MKSHSPLCLLLLSLALLSSCGSLLDGSTSDGTSLESAAGDDPATGGGGAASCTTNCKIFVTAANHNGGFGLTAASALAAMDSACSSDANKPSGGGTYKALVGSSNRTVGNNWPLRASTAYYQADGATLIGTTTAGSIFSFPLSAGFTSTGGLNTWSGLTNTFALGGSTCVNWTSSLNSDGGDLGAPNLNTDASVYSVFSSCDTSASKRLTCVQQ